MCITFVQRRPNVEDVGPALYKGYTNVLCLPGRKFATAYPGLISEQFCAGCHVNIRVGAFVAHRAVSHEDGHVASVGSVSKLREHLLRGERHGGGRAGGVRLVHHGPHVGDGRRGGGVLLKGEDQTRVFAESHHADPVAVVSHVQMGDHVLHKLQLVRPLGVWNTGAVVQNESHVQRRAQVARNCQHTPYTFCFHFFYFFIIKLNTSFQKC